MTNNFEFQKPTLNEHQKLWLNEVHRSDVYDVKTTKVKLFGKIPNDFDPKKIDQRLYRYDHLTLVGIWHIDSSNTIFSVVDKILVTIKEHILASTCTDRITAKELAEQLKINELEVENGLRLMSDLANFNQGSTYSSLSNGYSSITIPSTDDGFDAYLSYVDIYTLMEKFFIWKPPTRNSVESTLMPFVSQFPATAGKMIEPSKIKLNTAFIIMPINPNNPELEDIFHAIVEVCNGFGISATRADFIEHQESITDVILKNIRECEFLIADLSYERPNVYYEVGFAHALGKRPILFRKTGTNLHFDLANFGCPEFRNITELKTKLENRFKSMNGIES